MGSTANLRVLVFCVCLGGCVTTDGGLAQQDSPDSLRNNLTVLSSELSGSVESKGGVRFLLLPIVNEKGTRTAVGAYLTSELSRQRVFKGRFSRIKVVTLDELGHTISADLEEFSDTTPEKLDELRNRVDVANVVHGLISGIYSIQEGQVHLKLEVVELRTGDRIGGVSKVLAANVSDVLLEENESNTLPVLLQLFSSVPLYGR